MFTYYYQGVHGQRVRRVGPALARCWFKVILVFINFTCCMYLSHIWATASIQFRFIKTFPQGSDCHRSLRGKGGLSRRAEGCLRSFRLRLRPEVWVHLKQASQSPARVTGAPKKWILMKTDISSTKHLFWFVLRVLCICILISAAIVQLESPSTHTKGRVQIIKMEI